MSIGGYLKQIFGPSAAFHHPDGWAYHRLPDGQGARYEDTENGRKLARDKPRLAAVRSAPSREEFAAWRDHPVTLFVFAAYRAQIETCEQSWLAQSWEGGKADQRNLDDLKARADTYAALEESSYEGFCEAVGVEPEPVEADKEWARG